MRRVTGLILAGLGAFLIVVAVLLRTVIADQVIKFPINTYVVTTLLGSNVSYFSPSLVKPITGATMRVTDTVKGDPNASTSSTAVWNEFTYLYDVSNAKPFQYSSRRAAFDRRTSQLVNCCGANIGGNKSIRQTGLSGYVWPFGTQKQTYNVFDTTLLRPMPYTFEGTGTISGITVYRFVEQVAPIQAGTQTLPGSLVGSSQPSVTLPQYYTATNTDWVDPVTGAILNVTETQQLLVRDATGANTLLLFDGHLAMTPQSIQQAVNLDKDGRNKLNLLNVVVPLVAGLVGLAALITGILLARRRGDQPEEADTEQNEPALA
jgi:Porin PorA